jgi:multisubunit Na+/H+ antiporter MnhB subunit
MQSSSSVKIRAENEASTKRTFRGCVMRRHSWSIGQMMAATAILAIGMAGLLAVRPRHVLDDPGVGLLATVLAAILTIVTVAAELALRGQRHRTFWLGFAATGWLCAVTALAFLEDTRRYLLRYGPPIAREREVFKRQYVGATIRGMPPPVRPSELYLLASLIAEVGFGLTLGVMATSAGGLVASAVPLIARAAKRRNSAGPVLHRSRRVVASESDDP